MYKVFHLKFQICMAKLHLIKSDTDQIIANFQ